MYLDYYIMGIILLPALIFASYAQFKVNSTYNKYSVLFNSSNITAGELVKRLLGANGMNYISVTTTPGKLTDHFNPRTNQICLSQEVYSSSSVAALGVACHELGHAMQAKEHYGPYTFRKILIPISNIASTLLWPLVILGLIFNFGVASGGVAGNVMLWSGIGFFGIAVLLNLATLPVEYNASNRAISMLRAEGILTEEELSGTKKVLNAAALTYVAALVVSVMNLLRFLIVIFARRRDD